MSEGRVRCERREGVAHILFDRPAAHNALTSAMWHELADHCGVIARDGDVRAVTFRGAGDKAFISGNDISGFLDFETGADGVAYEREVGACVDAVEQLPQPTIALVNGWAVGGGLAISLACDFRLATAPSRFGSPIARTIGNCLSAKGYARILRHVGPAVAKRMLLLGEMLTAEEMAALGLMHAIVAADDLGAAGDALAARLKDNAPLTMRATKEAFRRLAYADLPDMDDLIADVYGSRDFQQAVRSFMAKEKPVWKGE